MTSKLTSCTLLLLIISSQAFAQENGLPENVYTWNDLGENGYDSVTLESIDRFTDDYTSTFEFLLNNPDLAKESTVATTKQWKNVNDKTIYKTSDDDRAYTLTVDQLEYMRDAIELKSQAYETLLNNGIVPADAFANGVFSQDGFVGSISSGVALGN